MVRRRPGPQDAGALAALRGRLLAIVAFIERAQDFPSGPDWRTLIESTYAKHDVRSMRLIEREIAQMLVGLSQHQRDGLDAVLAARFDDAGEWTRSRRSANVASALRRGSVASEKERRNLEDYAELLEATGEDPETAVALRRLLNGPREPEH